MCLMSVSLALVFPVAMKCCPGFPGCFPESRPWGLSLGVVVICHSLHVTDLKKSDFLQNTLTKQFTTQAKPL